MGSRENASPRIDVSPIGVVHTPHREAGKTPVQHSCEQSLLLPQPSSGSVWPPTPIASTFAALHAATAVAMALVARKKGNPGQHIEVSLHGAGLVAQTLGIMIKSTPPPRDGARSTCSHRPSWESGERPTDAISISTWQYRYRTPQFSTGRSSKTGNGPATNRNTRAVRHAVPRVVVPWTTEMAFCDHLYGKTITVPAGA